MKQETYLKKSIDQIPRVLSLEDRDFSSPTFGCFDRKYWSWKFKDFPDATLQRNVYPLSLVYSIDFKGNEYFKNKQVEKWIKAGILYWVSIQHKNGSFDQAFPNEYSFGATAFTLYPMIKSFLIVKNEFSSEEKKGILSAFRRAAGFLVDNNEVHGFISNHLSGAALSLDIAGEILKEEKYIKRSRELINLVLEKQSEEGWFLEYEGPDPGYETLGLSYLAKYYQRNKNQEVLRALKKSIEFLSYFVHPDGTIGGKYGSRNTELFYPAGLEIIKNGIPLSVKILEKLKKSIGLSFVDEENLSPLLESYLEAYINSERMEGGGALLPCEEEKETKFFKKSKIFIQGNSNYYLICNAAKGGVLKIFDKEKIVFGDDGFLGRVKKDLLTTQILNPKAKVSIGENRIEIEVPFMKSPRDVVTPLKFIALRVINLTVCKNIYLGNFIKKTLIRMLITKKKAYPVWLKREIVFGEREIEIRDILTKEKNIKFKSLDYGKSFFSIHMGSAGYFNFSQLEEKRKLNPLDLEIFNKKNKVEIINKINF